MPRCTKAIGSAKPCPGAIDEPFPMLISYYYLRSWGEERIEEVFGEDSEYTDLDWMLDSGAFSAATCGGNIDLDEYLRFIDRYGHRFKSGYIALDVIGNGPATEKNLDIMYDRGYHPMPVHTTDEGEARLNTLFERSDKVFFGGFKRPRRGAAPREYILERMRWAAGRDVHWLGYTKKTIVTALLPHSIDSSSWAAARMFGAAKIYIGNGSFISIDKEQRFSPPVSKAKLRAAMELAEVTPELWEDINSWRGRGWPNAMSPHQWVTTLGYVQYVVDLRKHFGTKYHLVAINLDDVKEVTRLVRRNREASKPNV